MDIFADCSICGADTATEFCGKGTDAPMEAPMDASEEDPALESSTVNLVKSKVSGYVFRVATDSKPYTHTRARRGTPCISRVRVSGFK